MGKHVLIVGAGIIGLSTAYYAVRKGHRVTILERGGVEGAGCSFGNAGMIVPSHFIPLAAPGMVARGLRWMWDRESPFYVRPRLSTDLCGWAVRFWRAANAGHVTRVGPLLRDLHLASREAFEEIEESLGGFGLTRNGLLMLCKTRHGLDEEAATAEAARALGIPADVLDARQTAKREPGLRMDVAGSVYFPMDAHLDPGSLMERFRRHLERQGVTFSWHTEVTGWRVKYRRVEAVVTCDGERTADEYVLSAGAYSTALIRDLRLQLPMQAGKGYSLTLTRPRVKPAVCAILSEARVAVTPMGGALRFGGTMELTGLDTSIDPARVRGIVRAIVRYLPDFTAADFLEVPPWCGLRPCSPDGLPYLGRFARFTNVSTATGHSMLGVSLAPITGRLMAEILSDEEPSLPVAVLSPDRYA